MPRAAIIGLALLLALVPCLTRAVPFGLGILPDRWVTVGVLGSVYAVLVLGLVVVTGWSGQFILGYAGFFAIGAYTYGLLNSYAFDLHLGTLVSLPIAIAVNVVVALALGLATRRVRGDFFALVTLAFGEMVRISITNLRDFTGGSAGLLAIDPLTLLPGGEGPSITSAWARYSTGWLAVALLAFWIARVRESPLGRSWVAIREDEEAAKSIGIATVRAKLVALAMAAGMAAIAGCLFAASQLSLVPSTFSMLSSFIVVTALVVGGMGSVPGAVLGTVLLLAIPEFVRDLSGGRATLLDYQMLIYGGAMLAVILLRPGGLATEPLRTLHGKSPGDPDGDVRRGAVLELKGLTARYGGVTALDRLDLVAPAGQVIGIIGPNGSGKTTLLNVISGFHPAADGEIRLDGTLVRDWVPERRARAGVARTFQMNRLFIGISNAENVAPACDAVDAAPGLRDLLGAHGRDDRAQAHAVGCLSRFPGRFPKPRWTQLPTTLSYANRRRLEMARGLGTRPRLLLLDEPTAGMNPVDRGELLRLVREWADRGTTVIIVEHQLGALAEVADRLVALDHGVVIADGPPESVLASEQVVSVLMSMESTPTGQGQ